MYYVFVLFRKAFEVLLPEGVSFRPEPGSFGHVIARARALSRLLRVASPSLALLTIRERGLERAS